MQNEIRDAVLGAVKTKLGGKFDAMELGAKSKLEFAASVSQEIAQAALRGEDTKGFEDALEAIMANWNYKHSEEIQQAYWETVGEVFNRLAAILGTVAGTAMASAVKSL